MEVWNECGSPLLSVSEIGKDKIRNLASHQVPFFRIFGPWGKFVARVIIPLGSRWESVLPDSPAPPPRSRLREVDGSAVDVTTVLVAMRCVSLAPLPTPQAGGLIVELTPYTFGLSTQPLVVTTIVGLSLPFEFPVMLQTISGEVS